MFHAIYGANAPLALFCSGVPMPAAGEGGGHSASEGRIGHALSLLAEALRILDDIDEFPELRARLQEIIDALQGSRKGQRS